MVLCAALAQGLTSLRGIVLDPTGAAVPGANLTLLNVGTQAQRSAQSDAQGSYNFPQMQPGLYKLTAKAAGFNEVVINDVRLLVSLPATINVSFEVLGATTQIVEVSADSVQVNTSDATLGNTFGTKPINQLPFEARNVVGLLALQPGVSYIPPENQNAPDRSGSVNGGKSDQANVTLDGVDVNDQQTRQAFTSVLRVTLDSVQEFRVTTTNANADQGRTSGAQISLVTKSGTNELHGSAYWYVRNKATNANSFFNNSAGVPLAKLNRNIYGTSVGGPIKKNKAFFFLNYEGRQDRRESSELRTVPTQSLRDGVVKYLASNNSIVTLTSGDLARRLDPKGIGVNQAMLNVFKLYPLPNSTEAGDGLNTAGFRFNSPIKVRQNTYIAKLDYQWDNKTSIFFRGNLQNDHDNDASQFPGQAPNNVNLDNSKGFAIGVNSSLRPNLISVFRYGLTRQGIENTGISTVNQVTFRTFSNIYGLNRGFTRISPTHNLSQDFTWVKGSHNIQFGGTVRQYTNDRSNYANSFFTIQANASWMQSSGGILNAPFTDMLPAFRVSFRDAVMASMGVISQVTSNYNYIPSSSGITAQAPGTPVLRRFRAEEAEMYVQDTWKITRALTLTAGLRFGYFPPVYETNGIQTNSAQRLSDWFDQRVSAAANGQSVSVATKPVSYVLASGAGGRPLYDTMYNPAPRFALAYAPTGRSKVGKFLFGDNGQTSIRAGWGMYYDLIGNALIRNFDSSALGLSTSLNNPSGRLNLETAPRFTGLNTIPQDLIQPAPPASFPVTQPENFAITNSLDDKLKAPYTMNMNFSIGREFKGGLFVQTSYVGRLSRRTLTSEDLATPTNLRDPASGQTYFEAAQALTKLIKSNASAASVGKLPFWENLFPGLAGSGLTATQAAYQVYKDNYPDATTALESIDRFCDPGCSKYGKFTMFSPQFSYLRALRSVGNGNYHAFQLTVRKRFRNGDQIDLNYALGKSIDRGSTSEDNAGAGRGIIINPYARGQQRAVSDYDTLHTMNGNWVVGVPVGKGKHWLANSNRLIDAFVGGWQFGGLWRVSSGFPVSVGNGRFWPTNYNITGYATQVAAISTSVTKNAPKPTAAGGSGPNLFADPAAALKAFDYTMPGEIGNRNILRGDGIFNIDMNLGKRWNITEKHTVQLRWEVFNVTNSVRFDPRNNTTAFDLGNANTFGRLDSTFTAPRIMQFALRYEF